MTTEALKALDSIQDPALREIVSVMTNLLTIRLALEQCPDFPYVKNVREANEVALLAIDAKMELYFATQTK